ncbi:MAG: hypothetical protein HYV63_08465 [Candidatus Schekmanbacteria bacterium]|nr:hypothetical protein [Candidatus Schekmanbacteria bacterium]
MTATDDDDPAVYAARATADDERAKLERLSSGLRHELNNPATALLGNVRLLARFLPAVEVLLRERLLAGTTSAAGERLDFVLETLPIIADGLGRSAERIVGIIRGLSEYTADKTYANTVFSLNDAVRRVAREVEARPDVLVPMEIRLDPRPVEIEADEGAIHDLIRRLVDNAVEAVATVVPESRWVELETRVEGSDAVLYVRDSGAGLPRIGRERVFYPFFTTKKSPHLGLGLAVAADVVSTYCGSIAARERHPRGTELVVHLPRRSDGGPPC